MPKNLKKGMILITVLIMITACTTIALLMHEKSTEAYASVSTLYSEYQGAIYAMTAIEALSMAFALDDANFDSKEDIWNMVPPIPLDRGFLTVHIMPLNAKLPLELLGSDNDTKSERVRTALETLFREKEIELPDIDELQQWMGSMKAPANSRFDEDSSPYSMKGGKLSTLGELAFIPSFQQDYKKIAPFVSIGGDNNKINLNMAEKEIINAYIPELSSYVDSIIEAREEKPFKSVSEIYTLMGGTSAQELYSQILPFIDIKSTLFYVKLELNIGDDDIYYHLLMQRNGRTLKAVKYIEGNNVEYF